MLNISCWCVISCVFYIFKEDEIIDHVVKRREENKIKNNKNISFKEISNEYELVTCTNEKSKRLVAYSSIIMPRVI